MVAAKLVLHRREGAEEAMLFTSRTSSKVKGVGRPRAPAAVKGDAPQPLDCNWRIGRID